jgi:hypothetical protein
MGTTIFQTVQMLLEGTRVRLDFYLGPTVGREISVQKVCKIDKMLGAVM